MDVKKALTVIGIALSVSVLSSCAASPAVKPTSDAVKTEETSSAKASIASESTLKPSASSIPTPSSSRTEVVWADYDPGTQSEIDRMTTAGDCLGINSYFGMATATEDSVKARTGHGNEALTKYLNESLALAQCN